LGLLSHSIFENLLDSEKKIKSINNAMGIASTTAENSEVPAQTPPFKDSV